MIYHAIALVEPLDFFNLLLVILLVSYFHGLLGLLGLL
jgi:hypothetical protein